MRQTLRNTNVRRAVSSEVWSIVSDNLIDITDGKLWEDVGLHVNDDEGSVWNMAGDLIYAQLLGRAWEARMPYHIALPH